MNVRTPSRAFRPWSVPPRRRAHGALALTAVLAVVGGCTAAPSSSPETAGPTDPAVSSPTVSPAAEPTTSAPSPEPSPEPSPGQDGGDEVLTLHVGGAIGSHPVRAPESEVVPYLTGLLGAEPVVEGGGVACETNGLPGRRLVWDGLTVLVRTTDETDATTEPYVAGWALDERSGTSALGPLSTAEGVGLGDPEEAVVAAYPGGQRFEVPEMGMSLWVVGGADGDPTDDLAVRLVDGEVTAITGGFGCGE